MRSTLSKLLQSLKNDRIKVIRLHDQRPDPVIVGLENFLTGHSDKVFHQKNVRWHA
jgi:hypothetical protein